MVDGLILLLAFLGIIACFTPSAATDHLQFNNAVKAATAKLKELDVIPVECKVLSTRKHYGCYDVSLEGACGLGSLCSIGQLAHTSAGWLDVQLFLQSRNDAHKPGDRDPPALLLQSVKPGVKGAKQVAGMYGKHRQATTGKMSLAPLLILPSSVSLFPPCLNLCSILLSRQICMPQGKCLSVAAPSSLMLS